MTQEFAIVGDDLRDGFGAKVDVRREDVEVIVVRGRGGIFARKVEEAFKIRLALVDDVVPVGKSGEVNDGVGVEFFGGEVGDFDQLVVIFDRAFELRAVVFGGDVGLVPDDPVPDLSFAFGDDGAHECRPHVAGIIDGEIETARDADVGCAVGGPDGRAHE